MMRWLTAFVLMISLHIGASAQEPFRLQDAVNAPDWLTLKGQTRARYETLEGQFRAGREGSDQLLALRTLLLAEADAGPVSFGVELIDSRTYLGDEGTPLSSGFANPLDVLQAYVRADDLPGVLGANSSSTVTVGRQTVAIGSTRQIERPNFANNIRTFTGVRFQSTAERGDEFHAIYLVPVARLPNTRPEIDDNEPSGDEEEWERRFWGLHYRRADLTPAAPGLWGELFVYGFDENDTASVATADRSYVTTGFRLYRKPTVSQWDIDLESAFRQGTRYATRSAADTQSLEVNANMVFAALGYTFDAPWRPRVALEYYYTSGDEDPNDLKFDQYERLFASRRTDLNNTSIHGPLTPANLNAPGFRLEVKPNARWDGRIYYHAAHLASDTDSWVVARHRDPTGQSGSFIGHTLDARARYWVVPDNIRFELGASAIAYGEFTENVPGGPDGDGTLFGYAQVTVTF